MQTREESDSTRKAYVKQEGHRNAATKLMLVSSRAVPKGSKQNAGCSYEVQAKVRGLCV